MKKLIYICGRIALVVVIATLIKAIYNNEVVESHAEGRPSDTITSSRHAGLLVHEMKVVEGGALQGVNIDSAWVEKNARDQYLFFWVKKREPLTGFQVVILLENRTDVMLWPVGTAASYSRSRNLHYSGPIDAIPESLDFEVHSKEGRILGKLRLEKNPK